MPLDLPFGRPRSPAKLATYSTFRGWRRSALKATLVGFAAAFCVLYGAAYAVIAPFLLVFLALPVALLFLLAIWALPDSNRAPLAATVALFYTSLVLSYVWPNYLAVHIAGLPWITVNRLVGYPLALLCLICLSTSEDFRSKISQVARRSPYLSGFIVAFTAAQVMSVVVSNDRSVSIDKLTVAIIGYAWMAVGVYIFCRRGEITRLFFIMWGIVLFVGGIGLWQLKLKHVPWAGHIPSFLDVNDPELMQNVLYGLTRAYTTQYRVNSVFTTSLGLSEFTALIFPFVIHLFLYSKSVVIKVAAVATLPFMATIVLITGARVGVIGCLLSVSLYPAFLGVRRWRQNPSGLLGPAVTLAYPVMFAGVMLSTLFIGRLKTHIWGGGAQAASTLSRTEQLKLAIPLILHNPIGYGIGRGAATLNYQPFGFVTIDSYYLLITLEFGVVGFFIYYGMLALGIVKAIRLAVRPSYLDDEQGYAIPIGIALCSFFIIKSVFSQPDNVGLISLMIIMLMALEWRVTRREAELAAPSRQGLELGAESGSAPPRTAIMADTRIGHFQ
jgi:hypothetical protein